MRSIFIIILLSGASLSAYAQPQNSNWVFGNGSALSFQATGPVESTSAVGILNDRRCASMSDADGNLLFYADHVQLYRADGSQMPDGTFSVFCNESIVVPDPANTNRFYLIRSKNNAGLDYTLIDMTLDDGLGAIVEGQKEVFLNNQGGRLMAAPKALSPGYWLISVDNSGGSNNCFVRTFNVSADGIAFHQQSSASWTWVGWFDTIDDARLSPDCSLIAVTFKGHYFGMFRYDTEIGNTTEALSNSWDNFTSFTSLSRLEFSPNSEFLYTTGDNGLIRQYNVTSFNPINIGSSSANITSCAGAASCAYDLKLATDGAIYVINQQGTQVSRIPNPDLAGAAAGWDQNLLSFPSMQGSFFPRTANLLCGTTFSFSPQVIDVCLGDATEFSLNGSIVPDEVVWSFGDPSADEAQNTSTELNPTYTYPQPGSYEVTAEVIIGGESLTFDLIANVYAYPNPQIEPEIVLCDGETAVLDAGEAESWQWSTGATTQTIEVAQAGIYSVTAANAICEASAQTTVTVIFSPDFSLGPDQYICDETPVVLSTPFDVAWDDGTFADEFTIEATGSYSATASNACFTVTSEVLVVFVEAPDFGLAGRMRACEGDSLKLEVSVPDGSVTWISPYWTSQQEVVYAEESGEYTVVVDLYGCLYERSVEVEFFEFVDINEIEMPNIFSPNNDGVNDVYRPISTVNAQLNLCNSNALDVDLRIYNRWGAAIVEGACSWGGQTEAGADVSEGVYYYIVDLYSRCLSYEGERTLHGDLTLTRTSRKR